MAPILGTPPMGDAPEAPPNHPTLGTLGACCIAQLAVSTFNEPEHRFVAGWHFTCPRDFQRGFRSMLPPFLCRGLDLDAPHRLIRRQPLPRNLNIDAAWVQWVLSTYTVPGHVAVGVHG